MLIESPIRCKKPYRVSLPFWTVGLSFMRDGKNRFMLGLQGKQKMMVIVLLSGTLLAVLNMTLLSPALPTIMADLQVGATTVQWLTSGYSLVEAVVIPLNAFLVGRFSTRKLFIGGMTWFGLGSLVGAMAPSFGFLLLGRIMQAMATGVVMPMVFTLILLSFPREKRGSAMGVVGLIISFAPAIGPSLSGVLVDTVGWRVLFMMIAALAVVVVIFAAICLKNGGIFERAPFDALSVIFMSTGMVSLLYGLSTFSNMQNIVQTVVMIVCGLALLGLFCWRQTRLETPMLRVEILKQREYRTTVILIALIQASLVGGEVVLPIYVQQVLGGNATISGLLMLPSAIIGAIAGLFAGRLFDRYGVRKLVVPGALITGGAGFFLTTYGMDTSFVEVCIVFTISGLGMQFLVTPLNTWGVNSLDNRMIQHSTPLGNTTNQVGASFGTAIIVSLTGLAPVFAPAGADALTVTYTGVHLAFVGMFSMLMVAMVGILIFVRNPKKAETAAETSTLEGMPGVDRAWAVADLMNPNSSRLTVGATVRDAIGLMKQTETSGITILNETGNPVGFVSDGDILKYLGRQEIRTNDGMGYFTIADSESMQDRLTSLFNLDVMDIATKNVISVDAGTDPEEAFKMLAERRIKKLPVTRDGIYVGAISRRNVISVLGSIEQSNLAQAE